MERERPLGPAWMDWTRPVVGTGRYVQKRGGHQPGGFPGSVGEGNPHQIAFLGDLEVPRAWGEGRGVPAGGESRPQLFGTLSPSRVAQITSPGPESSCWNRVTPSTPPVSSGTEARSGGRCDTPTPQKEAWRLAPPPSSPKAWYIFVSPWEGGGKEGGIQRTFWRRGTGTFLHRTFWKGLAGR